MPEKMFLAEVEYRQKCVKIIVRKDRLEMTGRKRGGIYVGDNAIRFMVRRIW
jgi:hypothetical protein